jgi:hypothetical protein
MKPIASLKSKAHEVTETGAGGSKPRHVDRMRPAYLFHTTLSLILFLS